MARKSTPSTVSIRDALAEVILDALTHGALVVTGYEDDEETGERVALAERQTPSPSLLNVARQFCKDFPDETIPERPGQPTGILREFAKRLPFNEDDDAPAEPARN